MKIYGKEYINRLKQKQKEMKRKDEDEINDPMMKLFKRIDEIQKVERMWKPKIGNPFRLMSPNIFLEMFSSYTIPLIYWREVLNEKNDEIYKNCSLVNKQLEKVIKSIPSKKEQLKKYQQEVPKRVIQTAQLTTEFKKKVLTIQQQVNHLQLFINSVEEIIDIESGKKMNEKMKHIFIEKFIIDSEDIHDIHPSYL